MNPRVLLIDGDILVYKNAAALEQEIDWGDGFSTLHTDQEMLQENIENQVFSLQRRLSADQTIIAFSDKANFRKDLDPDYKANRASNRKPLALREVREWVEENYDTKTKAALEADDVLGIMATNPVLFKGCDTVICSADKDLRQIPGRLYDGEEEWRVTPEEGDRVHLFQTLCGDATDNYKGCPKVGPVTANRILDEDPSWAVVVAAFEKAKLTEEDALLQARLARILRDEDFNYKTQEPKLWTPRT